MKTGKRKTRDENALQRRIEAEFGAEKDFLLLRNSVGEAQYVSETSGKKYFVPYGLGEGSPDIVGIVRRELRYRGEEWPVVTGPTIGEVYAITRPVTVGIWLCWEIKDPKGVIEPHQTKCHEQWRKFGAIVDVIRSVHEAHQSLARAREFHQ